MEKLYQYDGDETPLHPAERRFLKILYAESRGTLEATSDQQEGPVGQAIRSEADLLANTLKRVLIIENPVRADVAKFLNRLNRETPFPNPVVIAHQTGVKYNIT